MSCSDCSCKTGCTGAAIIASIAVGVIAAFLQVAGLIALLPVFLWVVFGVAAAYLAVTLLAAFLARNGSLYACAALTALLTGAVGSMLLTAVLVAVGTIPTGILGAVVTGGVALLFTLMLTSAACLIRHLTRCRG